MSEDAALAACQAWQLLARAEGEAIRAQDWKRLADTQASIAELQLQLSRARPDTDTATLKKAFAELVRLEQENLSALSAARRELKLHFDDLDQSCRNLRRIQRSYSAARPAAWNSYS